MALTLVECSDKGRWDCFADESPHGSVFCRTSFLDGLGQDYRLLLVAEKDETLAGTVLVFENGRPYLGQFPLTMYQGVLLSRGLCQRQPHSRSRQTLEVLDFLLAELEKRFDRISFSLHYRFEDLRSFSWFHYHEPERGRFRLDLHYSGLLDLRQVADFEGYLHAIRGLRLREYRRAQAHHFTIEPSDDIDALDRLHGLTFERQGLTREHQEVRLLRSIAQAAINRGFGELLLCRDDRGTTVSATLFLYDQRGAYYLVGANDPEYRHSGSGSYVMLESLRRSQARGLTTVDFVGINSPNRGDFKTSFNAVPVPYFVATWEKPA
jgi:ribosomal protein S18 acetylase RimI-like enzyme